MAKKAITRMSKKQAPTRGLAAVAVGVLGYYGGRELSSRVDVFQERWWLLPGAMVVGGYALQHYAGSPLRARGAAMQGAGVGAMGAGAMLGATNYEFQSAGQAATETTGLIQSERWDTTGLVHEDYQALPEMAPYNAHAPARPAASDTGYRRRNSAYAF